MGRDWGEIVTRTPWVAMGANHRGGSAQEGPRSTLAKRRALARGVLHSYQLANVTLVAGERMFV
jgi:hypothetical protein